MSQQQNIEQQLWSYIDGLSTTDERSAIQKMIETNLEWKNKYQELIEMHQLVNATELEYPSMRFTKNVMEKIAMLHIAPATKNYINKKIIWGITGFFLTLIVAFLIYGFAQVDWNLQDNSKPLIDLSTFNIGKVFNNNFVNGFMMVNVLLGLALLDRVLANKRKKFHKQG